MTTFTTTITQMYTLQQPDPDYVCNAIWQVTGVDGEYTATIQGNTQFSSPESKNFIPYEDLTEAMIISWIPASDIESSQQCVQGQLNSLINPPAMPQDTTLPWAL
jgi:hypothetical protein